LVCKLSSNLSTGDAFVDDSIDQTFFADNPITGGTDTAAGEMSALVLSLLVVVSNEEGGNVV
jgi:hypothetical protein